MTKPCKADGRTHAQSAICEDHLGEGTKHLISAREEEQQNQLNVENHWLKIFPLHSFPARN